MAEQIPLADLFKKFDIDPESNLAKQWYMYGHPSGKVNVEKPNGMWGNAAGAYDTEKGSISMVDMGSPKRNADTLSHELGHQNIWERKKELEKQGKPTDYNIVPGQYNARGLRWNSDPYPGDILSTFRDAATEHYTKKRGLEVEKDPFTGQNKFTAKNVMYPPEIPANMISNNHETIAALRGLHGRMKEGQTFWDSPDGAEIFKKLEEKYDKQYLRKNLDNMMFPLTRFVDEAPPESIFDKVRNYAKRRGN
jgi:hypothetical protein